MHSTAYDHDSNSVTCNPSFADTILSNPMSTIHKSSIPWDMYINV